MSFKVGQWVTWGPGTVAYQVEGFDEFGNVVVNGYPLRGDLRLLTAADVEPNETSI